MKQMSLRRATSAVLLIALFGCGALDVSDPTAIEESDVANATGADLLRRDAVMRFYMAMPDQVQWTGMVSDELKAWGQPNSFDRRDIVTELRLAVVTPGFYTLEGTIAGGPYARWQEVRSAATLAIQADVGGRLPRAYRGELLALHGFATLNLAEGFCPGFPLHDIIDFDPILGSPLSTQAVFESALADMDSALAYSADSARVLNFARLGRARVLLGLGRVAEAATTVSSVPTAYTWNAEFTLNDFRLTNRLYAWFFDFGRSVASGEGINGLDFVTAKDPRVQTFQSNSAQFGPRYAPVKYRNKLTAPIVVASGIEARLIEAEAALKAGDANWLTILNNLRATEISPAMPALADPGSDAMRVDLVFRERAFWLFMTAHRLGDLRRLVGLYGRGPETVFPTGAYPFGGTYGPATSIAFPIELEMPHNPNVTGCTSR
jgi:hypothetical protein